MTNVTEEEKYKLCEEYSKYSIHSPYNNLDVYWCNNCNSLMISYFVCNIEGIPNLYCIGCNSFDVVKGNIFQWLKIVTPEKRVFKNLKEFKAYQCKVNKANNIEEYDSIRKEIEEEIESLYVWDI